MLFAVPLGLVLVRGLIVLVLVVLMVVLVLQGVNLLLFTHRCCRRR